MQFTEQDIAGALDAIKGIGSDKVYALAMALRDGVIQVQILKRPDQDAYLQTVALPGHPFYARSWDEVNAFLDKVFVDRPSHVMRLSDWSGFHYRLMLERH